MRKNIQTLKMYQHLESVVAEDTVKFNLENCGSFSLHEWAKTLSLTLDNYLGRGIYKQFQIRRQQYKDRQKPIYFLSLFGNGGEEKGKHRGMKLTGKVGKKKRECIMYPNPVRERKNNDGKIHWISEGK